jgi:hypothetical protein
VAAVNVVDGSFDDDGVVAAEVLLSVLSNYFPSPIIVRDKLEGLCMGCFSGQYNICGYG